MAAGFAKPTSHPGHLNWPVEELRHDKFKTLETLREFRYAAHHNWEFLDEVTSFMLETQTKQDPMDSLIERFKTPLAKAAAKRQMLPVSGLQKKLVDERRPLAEFDGFGPRTATFDRLNARTQEMAKMLKLQEVREEAQQEQEQLVGHEGQKTGRKTDIGVMDAAPKAPGLESHGGEEIASEEKQVGEFPVLRGTDGGGGLENDMADGLQGEQGALLSLSQRIDGSWKRREDHSKEQATQEETDATCHLPGAQQPAAQRTPADDAESMSSVPSSPNIPAPVRKSSLNLATLPAREPVRKSSGRQSPLKHVKNKFSTILKNGRGLLASSAAVSADAKASVLHSDASSSGRSTSAVSKTPSSELGNPTQVGSGKTASQLPGNHDACPQTIADVLESGPRKRDDTLKKEREDQARRRMKEIEDESRRQEQRLQQARQEQQRRAAQRAQADEKEKQRHDQEPTKRISTEINRGLDEFAARMAARENENKLKEMQRQREEVERAKNSKERQQRILLAAQKEAPLSHKPQMTRPQTTAKILMPSQERQKRLVEEQQRTRVEPTSKPQPQPNSKASRPSLKHQASQEQVSSNAKRICTSKDAESQQPSRLKGPPIRPSGGAKKPMGWSGNEPGTQQAVLSQMNGPKMTKAAHPMDMAKISKAAIPFAPNPNPAGPAFKTPGRPEPANGTMMTKSAHRPSPSQFQNGDSIDLPEIFTDDEDDEYDDALVPSWANTPNITEQLLRQETINPMKIFGQPQPLDMEKVFEKSKDRFTSFRKRTSSANWSSGDQLTADEIRKDLAARKKMRKDGGWTMEMAHQMS